jgi:hypothetical protein
MDGMPLHVLDGVAGIAHVPAPVEVFRDRAELNDQVAGKIFRPDLRRTRSASSLPMMNPGIRAAYEGTS